MKIFLGSIVTAWVWAASAFGAELLMVEADNCHYCAQWHAEIGHIYPKTTEGAFAPLALHNIRTPMAENVVLQAPVVFTPTFLLLEDGQELARIEGYPGEDFFWGLLGMMLKEHTDYEE